MPIECSKGEIREMILEWGGQNQLTPSTDRKRIRFRRNATDGGEPVDTKGSARRARRHHIIYITLKLHIDTLLLLDAPVVLFLLQPARRALAVVVHSRRGHGLGLLAELHAAINKIVELAALPPGDVD